ncbi:MAG TPA: anthranilate phosphoribosyltransferase [Phycisphaerae bacterium]|nr:anthranilate phosphoribosyltransferase [Phycisphaerae bacterium]HPS52236.1 anthranilate phosphoribosyltransferase [Phycisphaerae bacterium]
MNFSTTLSKIISHESLTRQDVSDVFSAVFSGDLTPAQMGGFLCAMSTKGVTFEELAGAASAMRAKASRIQVIAKPVVDTCGTGGDGADTFNISTVAAFVVAGAGVTVAKHGNRSASSQCGSADVLEELGLNLDADPEVVEEAVNTIGIGFMFARKFHGAMKYAASVRRELGVRTMFNMLGPLTNPAAAGCQVLGVYSPDLTETFANALGLLGVKRAFVVHGHDGLDEITVCDKTRVSELCGGDVKTYEIYPEQYFGELAAADALRGGDRHVNAQIARDVLSGRKGPRRNVVLINAAAALVAAEKADNIDAGIKLAEQSVDSGAAAEKLQKLIEYMR